MSILTSNPNNIKGKHDFLYVNDKSLLNDKTILRLPRVVKAYENTNNRVMIGEIGGLNKFTNFDTDVSFNVVNSYAVAFLHSMGAKKVTLSHELTLKQIEMIIDSYHERYNKHPNLETIIEGYEEAMISKFDLNKMYNIKTGYLEDEFKNRYKIESFKDYMIIYNYKKLNKNATEYYNAGVNCVRRNLL